MKSIRCHIAVSFLLLALFLTACGSTPSHMETTAELTALQTGSMTASTPYQTGTPLDAAVWNGEYDPDSPIKFYRQIASHMDDKTGWYFQFIREGVKEDPEEYFYTFHGMNMRYRYKDNYWSVSYMQDIGGDGKPVFRRIKSKPGSIHFGTSSEDEHADRDLINDLLNKRLTPEEMIALDPDQYEFRWIDGNMFFDLIREALSNPPIETMTYLDYPMWAMYVDPEYIDGYRFQIGFYCKMGTIDEIYIDVLYKTGTECDDYVQLSDLVEERKADAGQQEAFELIQMVRTEIKKENYFLAQEELYKDKEIGGIDFYRMYAFLNALHTKTADNYFDSQPGIPWLVEEISEEEFIAAGNTVH